MKKTQDPRHKTIAVPRKSMKASRKLSIELVTPRRQQIAFSNGTCSTPTAPASKQFNSLNFSNRNSGKINMQFLGGRTRQKSQLENYTAEIRKELLKLSYREKLAQIQQLFKTTRQLCKKYGYFYVTFAMLSLAVGQEAKINVWIHPDFRSVKPLHPIKKETDFECELECVGELKNLVKTILPTIDMGDGRTFGNVIAHLNFMKAEFDAKLRRNNLNSRKDNSKNGRQRSDDVRIQSKPIKTQPAIELIHKELEGCTPEDENNRTRFKIDQKHKETKSTLIESFRSVNSIRQRLRHQISTSFKNNQEVGFNNEKKPKRKVSWISEFNHEGDKKVAMTPPRDQPQVEKSASEQKQKKSFLQEGKANIQHLKASVSGKKLMSMSIEMESQINNLFNSEEVPMNCLYIPNAEKRAIKNSILSKVAQEFQDLF